METEVRLNLIVRRMLTHEEQATNVRMNKLAVLKCSYEQIRRHRYSSARHDGRCSREIVALSPEPLPASGGFLTAG